MIVIGLTGSIGMGKTLLAAQFAALGAKTCSADAIVHTLMEKGGEAVSEIADFFPSVVKNGAVDRLALGRIVFADAQKRILLEQIIHPMVVASENRFIGRQKLLGAKIVVLDIPLLFETSAELRCDATVVATAPHWVQRRRVLKRNHMTQEKFKQILASQMSDKEKRRCADYVVQTGLGRAYSMRRIKQIMKVLHA